MTTQRYVLKNRAYQVRWRVIEHIETIDLEGDTPYEVIVRPYKSSRSIEQNNLLHSWIREIANETGHTVEEIKDHICAEFLGTKDYVGLDGKPRSRLMTTSELNVEEMSALIERVTELGALIGAQLPELKYG
jgi:hypothetical protein|tara:strand:- start:27 stop:422 length:396 start_codon:yes stop_codon:yes gene_type:complete